MTATKRPTPPAPLPEGKGEKSPWRAANVSRRTQPFSPFPSGRGAGGVGLLALVALVAPAGAVAGAPDTPAVPTVAPAPRPAKPKFVAPAFDDTHEMLVFANKRPVRIRVTVRHEGASLGELWRNRLRKAFDFCDRDGNGSLSTKEVTFAFSDQGLLQLLQNGLYQPTAGNAPTLDALDRDGDAQVSFEEFIASYPRSAARLVRTLPVESDSAQNVAVTEAVFALLDADGNGQLTRDEVRRVEKFLATHDADEDECLSAQELTPNVAPRSGFQPLPQTTARATGPYPQPATAQAVVLYPLGKIPGTVTQQLILKHDRNGDFELTQAEIGFDDRTFATLDADRSGALDGEELDVWRTGPPDLELTLSLAPRAAGCSAKLADEKEAARRGFKIKQVENSRLVLHVGRQPIDLWAFSPAVPSAASALKSQYAYLFAQAANGKEHIDAKDVEGPNAVQFQFIRVVFDAADRNEDGKLTRDEFDAYFDLQDGFRDICLNLAPAVQTPTLFQLLDENRDGRLSVRELRTAWDRLVVLEEPGATVLTRSIIQPALSLRLTRSFGRYVVGVQPGVVIGVGQMAVPTKGPLWFRKMDRNGDGDVSRGEFVGTRAEFDAIDTDRDDLISLDEAEAFDKQARVSKEK
ncbi:EF-hand domain-containing protein [Gemmata sp. JC717]|uniref:EF-hand domain-containing protein n=1 Tax=Gemmata algarum TaxID=2975278 RepID=UPI0021BAB5EA|nr:EF-hand domain-containing protein [Gemmata algarum]MDY3553154.1 EF-hand domain-containing protein [Gemmata algarum]